MERSTNRRWLVTGALGFALLGSGCAGGDPQVQAGGPAVVIDAARPSTQVSAPPSGAGADLTSTGSSGKKADVTAAPAASDSAGTPDRPKKVSIASPKSVASPDSPESADTP
ncbi:hypothetical protein [Micropruina sonneratiae]|uniref:hypothetical protein n=1 Tax=Micropruina sonneratiae TaxID=2986940 RepID=UPI002226EBB3|nr:hypothetical protein [Micropruina sp. KQZ13P-5]MCW3158645.1 hypothetical protein [Micropruina sp. KQZ13P-5]